MRIVILFMNQLCLLCKVKSENEMGGISGYSYCSKCRLGWKTQKTKIEYDTSYYVGKSGIATKLFSPIAYFFYWIRKSYLGNKNYETWIDVGAGDGGFLETVKAKKRIGVEVSKSGRKLMEHKGLSTLSDKKFLGSRNLNSDVISFWHVLEHVENPLEYLKTAKRNLRKKGRIIIGVPNIDSLEFKVFKKFWFHLVPDFHLWHYSSKSLELFLKKSGFQVEYVDNWSIEHNPTGIIQSFINWSAHSDSVLHRLIKRGMDYKLSIKDIFWSGFWLTIGLPVVFFFWLTGVLFKMPGTFVVVAVPYEVKSKTRVSLR